MMILHWRVGSSSLSLLLAAGSHAGRGIFRGDWAKVVPITGTNPNLVTGTYLGAAAKWEAARAKVGVDSGKTGGLVGGNYEGAALKYPSRRDVKGETACTMACCS